MSLPPPKREQRHASKVELLQQYEADRIAWDQRLSSCRQERVANEDWSMSANPTTRKVRGYNYFDSDNNLIATIFHYTSHDGTERISVRMLLVAGIEWHAIKS
jgi:hypothetical protein